MGALAAVFMYLMAQAYARAEAQQLAPIHYTELIYASLIGYRRSSTKRRASRSILARR